MTTPRVLTFVEWYLPGEKAGGPVRSIDALTHRLDGRVQFDIVTRDRDFGEHDPYPGLGTGRWLEGHPGRLRYLRPQDERPLAILALLRRTRHDVLYINTLFSAAFALYPLIFRRVGLLKPCRVVLAPRGQLQPGALAIKRAKKRSYLTALRALGLVRGIEWHASSPDEEADIRRFDPSATIHVALDLRRPKAVRDGVPSPTGSARVIFLSRISRKKNLDGALRLLLDCTSPIEFDIYGELEEAEYWSRCRQIIASMPSNVTCEYRGAVRHKDVPHVFAAHDLLLLPTHGENFGHVIAEALEAGCLALISDRTPWRGLSAHGAGWDLPLEDAAAFTAAIEEYAQFGDAQRAQLRIRAREFAVRSDTDEQHLEANVRLMSGVTTGRCARKRLSPE